MQEANRSKSVEQRDAQRELKERQSEATSKETLSDLEESEKLPAPKSSPAADELSLPSPDGPSDEGRKDNDVSGLM